MLLEAARPIALLLCLLSLCAVFHAAFLAPASDLEQRALDGTVLLSLAAGICLSSGLLFRDSSAGAGPLTRTLPVQPYFDSEFPHEHDQFISDAATNWATMALARAAKDQ